ncbi:MAG: hypothetical protein ACFFED_03055 [Candidatus Thorarchaeota archaeon]
MSRGKTGEPDDFEIPKYIQSDERYIKVRETFAHAKERKKRFDILSVDVEESLRRERKGPRRALPRVEREIHNAERDWKASKQKLDDFKLRSKIRRAEIARAEEEFRHSLHKDVDLENPVELDAAKLESARKKFEEKVQQITKDIGLLEQEIPSLIQQELSQRGRLEQLRIERESIRSGFRDMPIEKDPRMISFLKERKRIDKEYDDSRGEMEKTISKVKAERKKKQQSRTDKSPMKKGGK